MKNLIPTAIAVSLSSFALAQGTSTPSDVYAAVDVSVDEPAESKVKAPALNLNEAELSDADYKLMDYVQYLQDSRANGNTGRRRQAANYLGWWLNQATTPDLSLDDKMPFLQYGESVPMFMAGYIEFVFTHPNPDPDKANLAGIRSVISYYKDNRAELGDDELLDKLLDLDEKGRLDGYIRRKLG